MKKKVCVYSAIIFAFLVGFGLGAFTYANRHYFNFNSDLVCPDGAFPDKHGCCPGELYTDMGDLGFNCCPESSGGADCFPPLR